MVRSWIFRIVALPEVGTEEASAGGLVEHGTGWRVQGDEEAHRGLFALHYGHEVADRDTVTWPPLTWTTIFWVDRLGPSMK